MVAAVGQAAVAVALAASAADRFPSALVFLTLLRLALPVRPHLEWVPRAPMAVTVCSQQSRQLAVAVVLVAIRDT